MTEREPDLSITSGAFWGRNPHSELQWMRNHDPVYFDESSGVWGISRYDDIKAIESDPATFSNAGGIRPETGPIPMMIDMDDPDHRMRRKLVARGFTPNRVREQEPGIHSLVHDLVDEVCEQGECDFIWDIAAWVPLIMIGDALGVEPEDRGTLLRWSDDLLRGLGTEDMELLLAAGEAFNGYSEYANRVMEDRRACPRDDLMSILVHAEVDGDRLDAGSVLHESLLILIGGDETTRHVMSGGAYQLLTDRQQWERLRADRALIVPAVEEMLRWVTPIKNMARTATRTVEFGGKTIEAGQKLLMLYPSANRDEAHFADPHTFEIERTPNDHVAFGFGTHFCLGSSLARLELRALFDVLLDRLPDLHLVDDHEPDHRAANFVSGYEGMKVAFTPTARRKPAA
ncbi:MAG: cytochrome P450 [Acidimicrobiia bacterium]|nr:cytochrome P450 [Acidimicrobiia bacterium]